MLYKSTYLYLLRTMLLWLVVWLLNRCCQHTATVSTC